jgi:hypothetical protein
VDLNPRLDSVKLQQQNWFKQSKSKHEAGANAGYSEGDSAQQEARAGLEAGESDPAGATATARR